MIYASLVSCLECGGSFSILEQERAHLSKIAPVFSGISHPLPLPLCCPGCREAHRLAFRNEWKMYRRRCDMSGKSIVSIYREDSPYKVIDQSVWWSDEYDPLSYGREYDFSRTFFEQFHALNLEVPKQAIQNTKSENSIYTNYSWGNKNCYLATGCTECEDCYYSSRISTGSKDICDCYDLSSCELCYECIYGSKLYHCIYSQNCHDSSYLIACTDCRSCKDCVRCSGLRGARFCIENKEYSELEYRACLASMQWNFEYLADSDRKGNKGGIVINCEDCSGDFLLNCSRCRHVFSMKESEDCIYFGNGFDCHDCVDCNFSNNCELMYYSTNLAENYQVLFSALVWFTTNSYYLTNCFHCSNLFGCSGMKRNSFCILNKQYSQSEYDRLCSKIIGHMRETGEWGKFFPPSLSPFPYNASVAFEYYPLEREAALAKGLRWEEEIQLPQVVDGIESISCAVSKKLFRYTPRELALYEKLEVPAPRICPEVRLSNRMRKIKRALINYL